MEDTPTIYEWAGGREAFARWLNAFYDLVEDDEELAGLFGGVVTAEHRDHVTTWWCEVMGGPAGYTENHGGYEHMLARHRGLAITADQRLTFVTLLSHAADLERSGKPIPATLRQQIESLRANVEKQKAYITAKQQEKVDSTAKFETELAHYREIRAKARSQP